MLTQAAIADKVFSLLKLSEEEKLLLYNIFDHAGPEIREKLKSSDIVQIFNKFYEKLRDLEKFGPTAKLWVQYFYMVTI